MSGAIAIGVVVGGVGLLTSCRVAGPPPPAVVAASPAPPPTTAAGCQACNGVWGTHGIATVESCVCRTHDPGKRCRDGNECEGACVATADPEREITEAGPPPRGYFVGRCSELITVFGCNRFIDRGAVARGPVPLGEPPAQMCVD